MSNYSFSVTPAHIDEWYDENRWWVNDLEYKHLVYLCGMFYVYQRSEQMKNPQLKIQEPAERQKFVEHLKSKFTFSKQISTSSLSLDKSTIDYYNDTVDISPLNALKIHPFFHKGYELFNDITKKGPTLEKVCNVNTGKTHTTAAFTPDPKDFEDKKKALLLLKPFTGLPKAAVEVDKTIEKVATYVTSTLADAVDETLLTVKNVAPTLIKDLITKWQKYTKEEREKKRKDDLISLYESLKIQKIQDVFDYITRLKRSDDKPKLLQAYYLYVETTHPDKLSLNELDNQQLKLLFGNKYRQPYKDDLHLIDSIPDQTDSLFFENLTSVMEKLVICNDITQYSSELTMELLNKVHEVKMVVKPDDQVDEDLFNQMNMTESIVANEYDIDVYKKLHLFWSVAKEIRKKIDTNYMKYEPIDKKIEQNILKYIRIILTGVIRIIVKADGQPNYNYSFYYLQSLNTVYKEYVSWDTKASGGALSTINEESVCNYFYNSMAYLYYEYSATGDSNYTIIPRGLKYLYDVIYNAYRLYYYHTVTVGRNFFVVNRLTRNRQSDNVVDPSNWLSYIHTCIQYYNIDFNAFKNTIPIYDASNIIIIDTADDGASKLAFGILSNEDKVKAIQMIKDTDSNITKAENHRTTLLDKTAFRNYLSCLVSDLVYKTKYTTSFMNDYIDDIDELSTETIKGFTASRAILDYNYNGDLTSSGYESFYDNIKSCIIKGNIMELPSEVNMCTGWPRVIEEEHKDGSYVEYSTFGRSGNVITDMRKRIYSWVLPNYTWEDAKRWAKAQDNIYLLDETKPPVTNNTMNITYKFGETGRILTQLVTIPDKPRYSDASIMQYIDSKLPKLSQDDKYVIPGGTDPHISPPRKPKTTCQSNWRWIVLGLVATAVAGAGATSWLFGVPTAQSMFPYAGQQLSSPPITITNTVLCNNDLTTISPHAYDIQRDYSSIIKQLEDELQNAQSIQTFIKVRKNLETYKENRIKLDDNLYITNQKNIDNFIKKYFAKHDINDYDVLINSLNIKIPPVIPLPTDIQSKIDNVKKEQESFNTSWEALKATSNTTCMDKETLFKEYGELLTCPSTTTDGGCGCMMMDRPDGGGRRSPKKNAGVLITGRTRSGRLIKAPKQFVQQQWVSESKRSRKRVTTTRSRSRKRINNKKAGKKTSPKQQQAADGNSLLMVQTPVIPFNSCKVFKNI